MPERGKSGKRNRKHAFLRTATAGWQGVAKWEVLKSGSEFTTLSRNGHSQSNNLQISVSDRYSME
jgi:hypothetical protein